MKTKKNKGLWKKNRELKKKKRQLKRLVKERERPLEEEAHEEDNRIIEELLSKELQRVN